MTSWFAVLLVWVLPALLVGSLVTLSYRHRQPDPEPGRDPN